MFSALNRHGYEFALFSVSEKGKKTGDQANSKPTSKQMRKEIKLRNKKTWDNEYSDHINETLLAS